MLLHICSHLPCYARVDALLQDAPYVLEGFSDNFAEEEPVVKVALLTAALKLFFKRPPECRQDCPGWAGLPWLGWAGP
jgi:hypothetical protein